MTTESAKYEFKLVEYDIRYMGHKVMGRFPTYARAELALRVLESKSPTIGVFWTIEEERIYGETEKRWQLDGS